MDVIHPVRLGESSGLSEDDLMERLAVAQGLAAEAGRLAMQMRPPPGAAQGSLKARQDWLTAADGAVERFLSDRLLAAFPGDGFQGEEEGATRPGHVRWVVDPIDGTSNFARGASRWCVSVGLLEGEAAVLGVLEAPALGESFWGVRGGGAFLNGEPIRAAATAEMGRAIIECGWSPRVANADYQALCGRVLAAGAMLRSGGSGAMGLADVAAGRIDGYAELHINLWDCCAALAILIEAGAYVNDFLPRGIAAGGARFGLCAGVGGGSGGDFGMSVAAKPTAPSAPPVGEPAIRTVAMPADTNPNGDIFGGWLMWQMDLAAALAATRRARGRCATVAVEAITFLSPVQVGDEVSLYANVISVGRTSMRLDVQAWRRPRDSETSVRVTEAVFTFVAIDEQRRPRAIEPA